jgi:hypothetical protein
MPRARLPRLIVVCDNVCRPCLRRPVVRHNKWSRLGDGRGHHLHLSLQDGRTGHEVCGLGLPDALFRVRSTRPALEAGALPRVRFTRPALEAGALPACARPALGARSGSSRQLRTMAGAPLPRCSSARAHSCREPVDSPACASAASRQPGRLRAKSRWVGPRHPRELVNAIVNATDELPTQPPGRIHRRIHERQARRPPTPRGAGGRRGGYGTQPTSERSTYWRIPPLR